jgi:hypothetical protein
VGAAAGDRLSPLIGTLGGQLRDDPVGHDPLRGRRGRTILDKANTKEDCLMSAEDLERYETEIELALFQEYRAVLPMFRYVVETERRFYLANDVQMEAHGEAPRTYFEVKLADAWVWDMYRPARFVSSVRVVTFKDVNVEELPDKEI